MTFKETHVQTFIKRRNYKNGGASYSLTGLRGSIYISGGVFDGDAPETIVIDAVNARFAAPNAKTLERKAQVAERKAQREAKKAAREQARAEKKAAREQKQAARAEKKAKKEQRS
jgi:hypothetical protein